MLTGWVDQDRKLETVVGSASARRTLNEILDGLQTHRKLTDEEAALSDLSERVHDVEIGRISPRSDQLEVWPLFKKGSWACTTH